jgi:hypothetical protein
VADRHLYAVRRKLIRKIYELEGLAELAEEDSETWKEIQTQIDEKKKQLYRIEFMVYWGGEECEAR